MYVTVGGIFLCAFLKLFIYRVCIHEQILGYLALQRECHFREVCVYTTASVFAFATLFMHKSTVRLRYKDTHLLK